MKGLTDIPGIRVGHVSDFEALTGCTAVLCEQGAVGGVDIRGSASGTAAAATVSAVIGELHDPKVPVRLFAMGHFPQIATRAGRSAAIVALFRPNPSAGFVTRVRAQTRGKRALVRAEGGQQI